jgi:ferrous iron transport protein B
VSGTRPSKGPLTFGLAGNPNSGKTSLFNTLTGSHQHTGNWPGKTVERKEGSFVLDGLEIALVDLPGTYSLSAASPDEAVTRDYLLFDSPDAVIDVLDATNIERNLYLALQIQETGLPLVLALNLHDELARNGMEIDAPGLESLLGVPVVPTSGARGVGVRELLDRAVWAATTTDRTLREPLRYGRAIETAIGRLEKAFLEAGGLPAGLSPRFCALRLLEGDAFLPGRLRDLQPALDDALRLAATLSSSIEEETGEDVLSAAASHRYAAIAGIVRETVRRPSGPDRASSTSERIDRVVTGRFTGIPIFLLVMAALFEFSFTAALPFKALIEWLFGWAGRALSVGLASLSSPPLLSSLLVDGIVGGVGSVLVFLPNILLLFLSISLLEDSGYMARAAYVVDRFMHALGLHGRSFIPLLLGFGCNVPSILAARTLDNRKDRLITILISPLLSCSARLPVYLVFTGAFFGAEQGLVVFSLYLLGIVVAVLMGMLFHRTILPGRSSHFVMEFPPYRLPSLRNSFYQTWDRGASYIRKAGTVILLAVVVVWGLANLPVGVPYASADSYLGRIGTFLSPALAPAGFGFWQAGVALLFGVLAKEIVIGSLAVTYGVGEHALGSVLAQHFTPISAYSFLIMTLLYIPCAATLATIRKETGSWGWTAFAAGYTLALGWLLSVVFYQVASRIA